MTENKPGAQSGYLTSAVVCLLKERTWTRVRRIDGFLRETRMTTQLTQPHQNHQHLCISLHHRAIFDQAENSDVDNSQ